MVMYGRLRCQCC